MKSHLRPKKLALKTETLRLLDVNQVAAAEAGTTTIATTIFSEGACETFSWFRACLEN